MINDLDELMINLKDVENKYEEIIWKKNNYRSQLNFSIDHAQY